MLSIRFRPFRATRSRRFITGLALAAYLATACGLPIPVLGEKDTSIAFPCQNHACGCASAEQCWHSCCCYTPEQRLAWADAHHVTIPADVRQALVAAAESHQPSRCCLAEAGGHDHHDSDGHHCAGCAASDEPSVTWVLGIHARKCRGLSTQWADSGATMPLELLPLWQFDWTPVGRVTIGADQALSNFFSPAVPPPRA